MQANTGSVGNEPVHFPNFSVQNGGSDPFTIRNGRYVEHDGFVVPKNFDEFYERFPQYIRNWVRRHTDPAASNEDLNDWTQDLLIHLRYLPPTSKHREAGKDDVIQTFDPVKHHGANQARFQSYVNICLTNKYRTLHAKREKDALFQPGNVSLDPVREWGDSSCVGDEYCHSRSEPLRESVNTSGKRDADRAFVAEFINFVRREDPCVLPAVEAIALGEKDAQELRTTNANFRRVQLRLRELGRSFLNRERLQSQEFVVRRSDAEAKASNREARHTTAPVDESCKAAIWSRVELYTEVWEHPLVKLAEKYGVSDVRMGKVCRKLRIPHPGRGYWARRAVGQTVGQVPLSEFKDAPVVRRMKAKNAARVDKFRIEGSRVGLCGSRRSVSGPTWPKGHTDEYRRMYSLNHLIGATEIELA